MVGIATLTMKASTPNMTCADTTLASTHQRRCESTGFVTIWCMRSGLVCNPLHPSVTDFDHARDYLGGKSPGNLARRRTLTIPGPGLGLSRECDCGGGY